ncbi:hypothetical protein ACFLXU_01480 [Chloroflexota bacterium]
MIEALPTKIKLEAAYKKLDEVERLWTSLDRHLAINSYILGINAAILLDDYDKIPTVAAKINIELDKLDDIAAPELKELWKQAYVLENGEWKVVQSPFERFMNLNSSRIAAKAKELREQFAK